MTDRLFAFVPLAIVGFAFVLGAWTHTLLSTDPPHCFEDEVILWSGDQHDRCWPIDDLWMLQEVR